MRRERQACYRDRLHPQRRGSPTRRQTLPPDALIRNLQFTGFNRTNAPPYPRVNTAKRPSKHFVGAFEKPRAFSSECSDLAGIIDRHPQDTSAGNRRGYDNTGLEHETSGDDIRRNQAGLRKQ